VPVAASGRGPGLAASAPRECAGPGGCNPAPS
jgi:hypothetical protein